MNVAWTLYRALSPVLGSWAPAARWLVSPQERASWSERLGAVRDHGGTDAWIHAASLGESLAVAPLVAELRARQPDARFRITAATRTGRERLRAIDPDATLAPLDTPQAAGRFFEGARPRRLFLIETELWPQWLRRAAAEGVPVAVVSARLTSGSLKRYRWLGGRFRDLVGGLDGVLCQSEADAQRWIALGAPPDRARVVGNLKNDGLPEPAPDRAAARAALGLDAHRHLLVLGSLRPGEARLLARAWSSLASPLRDAWQVVAVPRHARSAAALVLEAREEGVDLAGETGRGGWRWDPGAGVLDRYYAAADVAFVGGTLLPYGGHNPLEPAARGAAVATGPHHENQAEAVRAMVEAGGLRVTRDVEDLAGALESLLGTPGLREAHAVAGLRVARAARGAARRAVAALAEWGLWPVR